MIICICKTINEDRIKKSFDSGNQNVKMICRDTGACSQCGKCGESIKNLIDDIKKGTYYEANQ